MKSPHLLSTVHDLAICTRSVQSSQKRRFHHYDPDCCLNNTWPSFFKQTGLTALPSHQQHLQILRPQATPVPPASAGFTPAKCTSSISVCRSLASANHTSSIRIPRSSPDLESCMVFELVSFDVASKHSCRSPSADCSHLKWKSQMVLLTTPSGSR